jgi:hypothetical protein
MQFVEHGRGSTSFQPAIPHQASHDRTVLLLNPRLVVLLIGPRPGQLNRPVFAETDQRVVDECAVVVNIETKHAEWK